MNQRAFFRIVGRDDEFAGFELLENVFLFIEAKVGFAMIFVRAVALVAILGQDGADVAVVLDRAGVSGHERENACQNEAAQTDPITSRVGHCANILIPQNGVLFNSLIWNVVEFDIPNWSRIDANGPPESASADLARLI